MWYQCWITSISTTTYVLTYIAIDIAGMYVERNEHRTIQSISVIVALLFGFTKGHIVPCPYKIPKLESSPKSTVQLPGVHTISTSWVLWRNGSTWLLAFGCVHFLQPSWPVEVLPFHMNPFSDEFAATRVQAWVQWCFWRETQLKYDRNLIHLAHWVSHNTYSLSASFTT